MGARAIGENGLWASYKLSWAYSISKGECIDRRYCCPSSSISLLRQILTSLFSVRWPDAFLWRFISKLNRFFRAFSVRPSINLEISDHFLDPSNSRTYSRSLLSSCMVQGPFCIDGLRKQFQCSLHCFGVRKTLFLERFCSYNLSETNFQLTLVF